MIPNVVYDQNGTITVELDDVSQEEAQDMEFLEPSSYSALWTWASSFCGFPTTTATSDASTTTVISVTTESSSSESSTTTTTSEEEAIITSTAASAGGTECQVGPSADPAMNCTIEGEFCQLELGLCNNKSGIYDGVCAEIPQVCTEEYNPVW